MKWLTYNSLLAAVEQQKSVYWTVTWGTLCGILLNVLNMSKPQYVVPCNIECPLSIAGGVGPKNCVNTLSLPDEQKNEMHISGQ